MLLSPHEGSPFEARHLIAVLVAAWSAPAPPLLLTTHSAQLLADLLDLMPSGLAHIEVPNGMLQTPMIEQRVLRAKQRGLQLVWRGEPGEISSPVHMICFEHNILSLTPEQALTSLRLALRQASTGHPNSSPVRERQVYESVANQALAEHCLDQRNAKALLGWPTEDVLHSYRGDHIQPAKVITTRLLKAIESDESMDRIEQLLGHDPILAYRFLRYTNSAGLGLRHEIDALRQGLMVLGLGKLKNWLLEQLPNSSTDLNLQPVRISMVLRAQFMAQLLDAGESESLKRELYLCGLLSQADLLLGEPLTNALKSSVLPARVSAALLGHDGPYLPYLEVATALENPSSPSTRTVCEAHGLDLEEVNFALLHSLRNLRSN